MRATANPPNNQRSARRYRRLTEKAFDPFHFEENFDDENDVDDEKVDREESERVSAPALDPYDKELLESHLRALKLTHHQKTQETIQRLRGRLG